MKWHLVGIILLGAIFSFWQLGRADVITDESSLATRAIKMVDFDFGIEQPTPWQWTDRLPGGAVSPENHFAVPWWMRLSFHDHPPLVFLLEHWSMRFFGENPFAIRLPSVIAGLAAVILVYLIGKRLYLSPIGAVSSLLFAFTLGHVWITRIGLQESILIALMLASIYCFLRFIPLSPSVTIGRPIVTDEKKRHSEGENQNWLWLMAAAFFLGLTFIAKYNALILVPIFASFFILHRAATKPLKFYLRRDLLRISIAIFIFLAVASPVIIYNLQLYRNFGHFDFQFSLLFGQDVKEWQARPGQEVLGSYAARIKNFIPRLVESNSPYFLAAAAAGLITILWRATRGRWREHSVILIAFAWLLPFLVFIGPAYRFLTLLAPWLAIAAGFFLYQVNRWMLFPAAAPNPAPAPSAPVSEHSNILKNVRMFRIIFGTLFAVLVTAEILYSYNSVIALKPVGRAPWTYAKISRYNGAWGFNELDKYLGKRLEGKMPEVGLTFEFPFAKKILNEAAKEGKGRNREAVPLAIIYNDNINLSTQLWVFLRRIVYQGWPVASAENFRREGQEFLTKAGVKKILFVNPTAFALQDRSRPNTPDGDILEEQLRAKGAKAEEMKNPSGEVAFRIYEFGLK